RIMHLDRSGGQLRPRELAEKSDLSFGTPRWWLDGNSAALLAEAEMEGYGRLCLVLGKGGPVPLTESFTDRTPEGSTDAKTLVWLRSGFDRPASVQVSQMGSLPPKGGFFDDDVVKFVRASQDTFRLPRQIDHFNDDLVDSWQLGKVENVTFKGAGDEKVQMW